MFLPANRYQVISVWGHLNQPAQMLTSVWVLVFSEDHPGTTDLRFLVWLSASCAEDRGCGHSVFALSYIL